MVYTANWGIICHLPPFRGTRNNHWLISRSVLVSRILYAIFTAFWTPSPCVEVCFVRPRRNRNNARRALGFTCWLVGFGMCGRAWLKREAPGSPWKRCQPLISLFSIMLRLHYTSLCQECPEQEPFEYLHEDTWLSSMIMRKVGHRDGPGKVKEAGTFAGQRNTPGRRIYRWPNQDKVVLWGKKLGTWLYNPVKRPKPSFSKGKSFSKVWTLQVLLLLVSEKVWICLPFRCAQWNVTCFASLREVFWLSILGFVLPTNNTSPPMVNDESSQQNQAAQCRFLSLRFT